MNWKIIFALLSSMLILGCGSKENFIVLSPADDGSVGALEITTQKGSAVLEEEGKAIFIAGSNSTPSQPTPVDEIQTQNFFQDALKVHPLMPQSFLLYFKRNSNELTEQSQALIPAILESTSKRESTDIALIGHTDRTGEDEYNQKLSLDRAKAVYKILAAENINIDDMSVTYHGEGNPLVPTADNVPEPKNRRVEVLVR